MRHTPIALTVVLMLLALLAPGALEVDEQELEAVEGADIEFESYVGPVDRVDSREAISAIGRVLGEQVTRFGRADYDGRYTAVRIVGDPAEPLRAADLIELLARARVDHIDNLRRIVSGYLQSAWGYAPGDADLLARFSTIYNAVHRGAIDFFAERYRSAVVASLDPATAGLSTTYRDWPGGTQLVIPIRPDREPGALDAIDPGQLVDELVILELRRRSDFGIEDRKAIIEFIERVIEERTEAIVAEREEIEAEREAIAERRAEIDEETAAIEQEEESAQPERQDDEPAVAPARETTEEPAAEPDEPAAAEDTTPADREERVAALEQERQDLDEQEAELDERERRVEQAEEEVEQLTERVQELYEETAEDQEQLAEGAGRQRTVPFMRRDGDGFELALIDIDEGTIVGAQTIPLAVRQYVPFQNALVAAHRRSERLLLLDRGSLDVLAESDSRVVAGASILALDSTVLTAVEDGGQTFIGEFDAQLVLTRRSSRSVDPLTDIAHRDGMLVVQRPNGTIEVLSLDELE